MNAWMRRPDTSGMESWHLLLGTSPRGMRVAHCGEAFAPGTGLLTVPLDDPPRPTEICEPCLGAARRMAGASRPMQSSTR
jgi:hypothetical protein